MRRRLKQIIRSILPRNIRPYRIMSGPLAGNIIVTSWHDYPAAILGRTEVHLLKWFSQSVNLGETWLDIGAHYGYTAIALCKNVGDSGKVFAFEPLLSTAGFLARTRFINRLNNLSVIPVALGSNDRIEEIKLPIVRGMIDSTRTDGWKESIYVAGLDWLWQIISPENQKIDGVKIDVQGMEVSVLSGMKNILCEHRPKLVLELHPGVDRAQVLDLLEQAGYGRDAIPVEPVEGEVAALFVDDRSYVFFPKNQ